MKLKTTGLVALLGVAALCFAAQAQQAPPPLISVVRVVVKPDRHAEWREITKQFSEAHKKGGGAFRHVWRSRTGNPHEYAIVAPRENYASFDSPGPARKGMSEADRARLVAKRRQHTQSVEITYRQPIPELTIPWASENPPGMIATFSPVVKVGMANDYVEHLKELVAAYKEAGIPAYGVHRMRWGGSRRTFVNWSPLDKMADLDGEGWLTKSMSEEAREKWVEKLLPMLESAEWGIWIYEEGLSYQTEQ